MADGSQPDPRRRDSSRRDSSKGGSTWTVVLAGLVNIVIGIAKLAGGILSGSSAMMSEAAHSFADTLNEVFLMTALRRSRKPADTEHPFGYGMERYFWSLLAAVGIFVLGAGFSAFEGLQALLGQSTEGSPELSYIVLAGAFLVESGSLLRAGWQLRKESQKAGSSMLHHLLHDAEPAVRAVFSEDGVAVIGLVLAGGGLALEHATGQVVWDAIASFAIALLLVAIAYALGRQNKDYLIGKAPKQELVDAIGEEIERSPSIDRVLELQTMMIGPDDILVAARVELAKDSTAAQLEEAADEVDTRLRSRFHEVRHVFLDPTSRRGAPAAAGRADPH